MAAKTEIRCVTVFGGSGFLGNKIVKCLAAEGVDVRVAVRRPDSARIGKSPHQTGNIKHVYADVRDETSVALAVDGCDAAVNSVGLYVEQGAETFESVHELGALNVAHQCVAHKVKRLIQISGIGADLHSRSSYVRARAKGELLAKDVFPKTTILRPSVLFGPRDKFINTLAKIIRYSPVVPLFGTGDTKLQPVYVDDVALATRQALQNTQSQGMTYELGGLRAYAYAELIELVLAQAGKRRLLIPLPFIVWEGLAIFGSLLPSSPLTRDQVLLMKEDNVVAQNALSLNDLDVSATALEDVLPKYTF